MNARDLKDPFCLARVLWPHVKFYREQREIIQSVFYDSVETYVPAGNMLGKDFVAGFIALAFFLTRHPCRVVTTSVDHSQLHGVLWGEMRRYIQTAAHPLEFEKGGPLVVNDMRIRKVVDGKVCGVSYILGRVAQKGEGMLGHHVTPTQEELERGYDISVPRTLFIADEASGIDDVSYERAATWAKRILVIGNPFPCNNFFKRGVKGGDIAA